MNRSADRRLGTAVAVRAGWGAFLLGAPDMILDAFGHRDAGPVTAAVRVLGVRHVAQAVLTAAIPEPAVVTAGAVADVLHAATAAAVALASSRYRRAALADSVVAIALIGCGWATVRGRHGR